MLSDVEGILVGHWTDPVAQTGVTTVLFPPDTVGSGEVRGGAPATREFALLDPRRTVEAIDAVVLSGGSAFGLSAADGVMRHLEAQGRGFPTAAGPVPIVVGMSIFDLSVGDGTVRPGSNEGLAAAEAASDGPVELGRVGAGTGATVGKWRGPANTKPSGLAGATIRVGDLVVSALIAVNALGDLANPGTIPSSTGDVELGDEATAGELGERSNTTIGVVATNAQLTKMQCHILAGHAHHGLARGVFPSHTRFDGDAFVTAATGQVPASPDEVFTLGSSVVTKALAALGDSI